MSRFKPGGAIWGNSQITARDQTRFFLRIDAFLPARHRAYALRLLRTVVPSQRWGVGRVALPGWTVYFKGGWGSGTGRVDNQVALLVHGDVRLSVAVLTVGDGSHAAGKETLRGLFSRLPARPGRLTVAWSTNWSVGSPAVVQPTLHQASPAELKARIEAERTGSAFLVLRDGDGVQQIVALEPRGAGDRRAAAEPTPTCAWAGTPRCRACTPS